MALMISQGILPVLLSLRGRDVRDGKISDGRGQCHYRRLAGQIMKSVYDNYAVKDKKESNGLVLHSTYSNHSPYNTCNHYGVDECNSWGDYFYMEALSKT